MGQLLPGARGSPRPDRLLMHAAEVAIDNRFPVPVASLSQFGHQSFDVTHSFDPTLLQKGFVGTLVCCVCLAGRFREG